jgi:hypothetical protein
MAQPWRCYLPNRSDVGHVIHVGPLGREPLGLVGYLVMFDSGECVWDLASKVQRLA